MKNKYTTTSDIISHSFLYKSAKSKHAFPYAGITGIQEISYTIIHLDRTLALYILKLNLKVLL